MAEEGKAGEGKQAGKSREEAKPEAIRKPAEAVKPESVQKPAFERRDSDGFLAEVVELVGRTGVFGEVKQVMAKVLKGRDQGRVIRRNVKGPLKKGDLLLLTETERESRPLRSKKRV